jgi:hypothetical protein
MLGKGSAVSKIATKPKWYHSWRLWLLGSFSVMGAVYGTVFLVIGLSSKNLQLVGFTFALYFVTFILVMSTWYAVFVRYQDRLFVRILMYDEKGRFQLEMLGTDPKVVKEAKPIPPGEKIDAEKIGVVRFSHTETVKLRIPWEWILLIIVKQATLAWLFMKLVLPALTT